MKKYMTLIMKKLKTKPECATDGKEVQYEYK